MLLKWILASTASLAMVACGAPAFGAPATSEQASENRFDTMISPADQIAWLSDLASAPNHVGSAHDKANADTLLDLFKAWGWDAHIETFNILFPTPITTALELIAPKRVMLGGQELPIIGDPSTQDLSAALPPYVAYQGDGDITAPAVYVNYGMPSDYEALARRGISVEGEIVVVRYGAGWRGLKPLLAQQHGAVGCLIYSDPANDGYATGDAYPRGGARPVGGVQRGSVENMMIYPGDPLTPAVGATADAKRLTRGQSSVLLKIPTLPISYGDAEKILAGLEGPVVTGKRRGALGMAYHWGGTGAVKLHLTVKSDWSLKPVYDVIATLKGSTYPDQWVIRGNHHDGWVFGAGDPMSGQVAMLSEAKALGTLAKQGWRPRRTIVYTSWDGEEPGLLGSTEWVETHAAELKAKAMVYINTDMSGRGYLYAQASHDLQHFIDSVARDVTDPESGVSLYERNRARILSASIDNPASVDATALKAARADRDLPVSALGSGSDYSAFVEHLGIASINLGFGGEDFSGGVYHSAYDTIHHFMTFDDPGLLYGAALSKVVGRLVMRAADGERFPARYSDFAATVATYIDQLKTLNVDQRAADRRLADVTADGAFKASSDINDPTVAPPPETATPLIDLMPLEEASDHLQRASIAADAILARADALPAATRARIDTSLMSIDQTLLDPQGLPGRPWYHNLIYAPGTLTGYGSKTLPGVREGIEQRHFDDARAYVSRTAAVLNGYADRLDAAVRLAQGT